MSVGRPSTCTPEIIESICDRIAQGELLPALCKEHGVSIWAFLRAVDAQPDGAQLYARARETRLSLWAEEITEIADSPQEGQTIEETADGVKIKRGDMTEHRKIRIDARKWLLARLASQLYGDKITNQHTGANGGPITFRLEDVGK
jgi:hypothetical protein